MIDLSLLIQGAAFRSDMQGSNRVLQGEWVGLLTDAIRSTWNLIAQARPDFQFASSDFTLVSGPSASTPVPRDFHSLIDVVFAPDTQNEYSLGPFAWQNRRAPGGWWPYALLTGLGYGGTRASLRGSLIYVEPSIQAGGPYRQWYCPRAHVPLATVRLATAAPLPACTRAGAGIGKTLTATVNALLVIDGQNVTLGDLILVKDQPDAGLQTPADNGVYVVTAVGSGAAPWVLTRSAVFDETTDVAVGDIYAVGQTNALLPVGVLNEGKFYTVATFTAIESPVTFSEGAALEQIIEQFDEVVTIKTAIPAMMRDGGTATTSVGDFEKRLNGPDGKTGLIGEMKMYFALVRTNGVSKMVDTDMIGLGGWRAGLGI